MGINGPKFWDTKYVLLQEMRHNKQLQYRAEILYLFFEALIVFFPEVINKEFSAL